MRTTLHLLGLAAVLTILSLFSSCAILAGSALQTVVGAEPESESSPRSTGTTEAPRQTEATPQLSIVTDPSDAAVWLDGDFIGRTPVEVNGLHSGTYRLRIEKDGYYEVRRWIEISDTGSTVIDLDLEMITGFLDVSVTPRDSVIRVDGTPIEGGFAELPIGFHRVAVQRFGYQEKTERVLITEQAVTRLHVTLEEAPFSVSDVSVSRDAFNPANPGVTGMAILRFRVTAPGDGVVEVHAEDGALGASHRFGTFTTWDQEIRWDGRSSDGRIVEDGTYRVTLDLTGTDGLTYRTERSVRVDSSLVVRYRAIWSSAPGFLFAPDLMVLPPRAVQLALDAGGAWALTGDQLLARFPATLGVRVGVASGVELSLYGGLIMHAEPTLDRFSAGGSATWRALDTFVGPDVRLRAGITAGGVYWSPSLDGLYAAPDSSANAVGFHLAIPVELVGPHIGVLLAPQVTLSPAPVSYDAVNTPPNAWGAHAYFKGALFADVASSTVALSAAVRTTRFGEGLAIEMPFQIGAEYHWVIPQTSLVLSGFAASEVFGPGNFYVFGGLGFGLLF